MTRLPAIALVLLAACTTTPYESGLDQPLRIREGFARRGALPGTPSAGATDAGATPLSVVDVVSVGGLVIQGQSGKLFNGHVTDDTYAIAVRFLDLGTTYWVAPVSGPDIAYDGALAWNVSADFGRDIPPGVHTLAFVALDAHGNAGTQYTMPMCVLPDVPDNYNACDPTMFAPPRAIFTLDWNRDVDLDLVVVTPAGKVVRGKRPTTVSVDAGAIPNTSINSPSTGILTRDSNSQCVLDGIRRESLVFQGDPTPGEYRFYASLYATCAESTVDYRFASYQRVVDDGSSSLERSDIARGSCVAVQADYGVSLGTFLGSVTFP